MDQPSQHLAPDEATRDDLIAEATDVVGILPPYERLTELDRLLRAELDDAIPAVQAQADALNHGTVDWYARARAPATARETCGDDLGPGLRSAAIQVAALGRCLGILDGYRERTPKPDQP